MFKSIFSKHFTVMSLVIVISFLAMGGMQMLFSTRYWDFGKSGTADGKRPKCRGIHGRQHHAESGQSVELSDIRGRGTCAG